MNPGNHNIIFVSSHRGQVRPACNHDVNMKQAQETPENQPTIGSII